MSRPCLALAACTSLAVALAPNALRAQAAARDTAAVSTAAPAPCDSSPSAHSALVTRRDVVAAGGLALAAVALMPFDGRLAEDVHESNARHPAPLRAAAALGNDLGDPGVLVAAVGLYGVGRLARAPHVATLGAHASAAIVVSGLVTEALKHATGRARPDLAGADADDFHSIRRRGGEWSSFPSGHTTAAFAFASAAAGDLRERHPHAARVATPLLYAGAATVGLARMYSDRHWASDVLVGAGIGTLVGHGLTRHAHANPDNWLDRHLGVAPGARGVTLGLHGTMR